VGQEERPLTDDSDSMTSVVTRSCRALLGALRGKTRNHAARDTEPREAATQSTQSTSGPPQDDNGPARS
jgi:hypothetical protein